jgi:hypothetical protein
MITRETIINKIQQMPEPYLGELYEIIKNFEATRQKEQPKQSLMAKLRNIKISASSDFSQTADLYVAGDKP